MTLVGVESVILHRPLDPTPAEFADCSDNSDGHPRTYATEVSGMKRFATILVIVAAAVLVGSAMAGDHPCDKSCPHIKTCAAAKQAKVVSFEGEIVEAGCFVESGQRAADNPECIKKCASSGMPMAFIAKDNTVYLIIKCQDAVDAYDQTKKLAAEKVEIKGYVHERGGLKAIAVTEIKQLEVASK